MDGERGDPYRPPPTELGSSQDDLGALTPEGMAAYAGVHRDPTDAYYLAQLERARTGAPLSFNLPAAFFGVHWCFYRRQFKTGLWLFAAELASSIAVLVIVTATGLMDVEEEGAQQICALIATVAVRVPFGRMANGLYLRAAADAERAAGPGRVDELRGKGGPWLLGVGLALLIQLVVQFSLLAAGFAPAA